MPMQPEAFFLPFGSAEDGQRYCLLHPTVKGCMTRGLVVYIHPMAEEMNKARRMAALQARTLAQAGYSVLQIDLLGCGDSSGDFGDATWQGWVNDVVMGSQWLREHSNRQGISPHQAPLWLWGLRAGCLLAAEAATRLNEACNFLFWQAPSAGKPLLQQFLRLKVAGDMLSGQSKGVMESMRHQLASGSALEIAGYSLSPELAEGLEQASLLAPTTAGKVQRMEWFELSTREGASLSPVSTKTVAQWQQTGFATRSHIVRGPAFWQTSEIEDAPELIAATVDALTASAT
ncbi:hydrolase 2, exosortase A system-associated [Rhodoferax sp.]|uniref:hydrolase 2, exosortase A system-associated n=1 Tax=Rhodoferax sp. TaxID=50421 RepID=UPI0025E75660|nr:hydrolase 2, exosortase A system-associated [Rhodoferax sp.]